MLAAISLSGMVILAVTNMLTANSEPLTMLLAGGMISIASNATTWAFRSRGNGVPAGDSTRSRVIQDA
jgi:hypothetical protein